MVGAQKIKINERSMKFNSIQIFGNLNEKYDIAASIFSLDLKIQYKVRF